MVPVTATAAYSCAVQATSAGVLYNAAANTDFTATATLNCTRDTTDANTLTYRLKADTSANYNGTNRRVRRGATTSYLTYYLRRGTTAGGAAACGNSNTWFAPANGTTNVITGTLNFGTALTASVTWGYCLRVRGTAGGNPAAPAAGTYTDLVNIFGQYPNNDAGTLTSPSPITYSVGVTNQCVFNTFPGGLNFVYNAFGGAQTSSTSFRLRCSSGLPWTVSVSPASAVVHGLQYTITPSPASGTGNGNTGQNVTLTGDMSANQAGTCATGGVCTATQPHAVTITY